MTAVNLKSCSKEDSAENWNTYFPKQACKYNFCVIPSIILLILSIKTKKLKPSVSILIRLSLS